MISTFPLMAISLIAYNVMIFGFGAEPTGWDQGVFTLKMVSGVEWTLRLSDLMIVMGLILLFLEILKATRIGKLSIVDHLLSTVVLMIFLVEFLLVPEAAVSRGSFGRVCWSTTAAVPECSELFTPSQIEFC